MDDVIRADDPPWSPGSITSAPDRRAEDTQLVQAALQDRAAFAPLYHHYLIPIYRYFYAQVGQIPDAEDLTATTFSKALTSLARYRATGSFAAWLFGIAHHTLLDFWRARPAHLDLTTVGPYLVDPTALPETQVLQQEQLYTLHRALRTLPTDQREALVMRYFGRLAFREIATVLGRSEGAVKMLVQRALTHLRTHYAKEMQL